MITFPLSRSLLIAALAPTAGGCSFFETIFPADLRRKSYPLDFDADKDGITDRDELAGGLDPDNPDTNGDGINDRDGDDDGDGLANYLELQYGFDPSDGDSGSVMHGADLKGNGVSDCDEDFDHDSAGLCWELKYGFDPFDDADLVNDADGDGIANTEEYDQFNPNDPASHPGEDDLLTVLDVDSGVKGYSNTTTVLGTFGYCNVGDQILFTSSSTKPNADDAGFIACTTEAGALTTSFAASKDGPLALYVWRKNAAGVVEHPVKDTVVYDTTGPVGGSVRIGSLASLTINLAITWPTDTDYASIKLRRYLEADCSTRTVAEGVTLNLTTYATAYQDSGLSLNQAYCYKIFWYDVLGNESSRWVAYDGIGPSGALAIKASPNDPTSTEIFLTHTPPTDADYASVVLRRNAGATCAAAVATDGSAVTMTISQTDITDGGLVPASTYCYKIFWYDSFGNFGATVPTGSPQASVTDGAHVCSAAAANHDVWYYGSAVSLSFECDDNLGSDSVISSVTTTSMPTWLTPSFSGATLTFSGTAPSSEAVTTWRFKVNGVMTNADAAGRAVTTEIINTSLLDGSLSASVTLVAGDSGNNKQIDPFTVDLSNSGQTTSLWDGSVANATLGIQAGGIGTDMHGSFTLETSCTANAAPSVCLGTSPTTVDNDTTKVKSRDVRFKWTFSPWDQGLYYLDVASAVTVEGSFNSLSATDRTVITAPRQGNGTVVTPTGTANTATFDAESYHYGIAVARGSASSALSPAIGALYVSSPSDKTYYSRLQVTRTSSALVQSWTDYASFGDGDDNTSRFTIQSLPVDNTWALVGTVEQLSGNKDLTFVRYQDGDGTSTHPSPVAGSYESLTNDSEDINDVATTRTFTDADSKARLGVAYVRVVGGNNQLRVAKLNPYFVDPTATTINDSADYDPAGTAYTSGTLKSIDQVKIAHTTEGANGWFYVVYHSDADAIANNSAKVSIAKVQSNSSAAASYGNTAPVDLFTGSSALDEEFDLTSTDQSLDLALGTRGGETVAVVVHRSKDSDGKCYVTPVRQALTVGASVQIFGASNTATCLYPQVEWSSRGRFVVTFWEADGANWDLYAVEVQINASFAASINTSTILLIANDVTGRPLKLATDLLDRDASNNRVDWMAVLYRTTGNNPTVTSFHVRGVDEP